MGLEGRARGFEPPNSGATSRCLNHLATPAMAMTMYQVVGWPPGLARGFRTAKTPSS